MAITQEEWTKRHRQVLKNLVTNNRPLQIAAKTAMKDMSVRIFEDGKKSDGSLIGQYDTKKPLYVNPNYSPRAVGGNNRKGKLKLEGLRPTRGNPNASLIENPGVGEHEFTNKTKHRGVKGTKAGDPHRTTWVKNYKDFRNRIGKRIDKVNLVLTGDLQSDFSNGAIKNPQPKKINSNEYVVTLTRPINRKIREKMEDKYGGAIFSHSQEEIAKFVKIADQELRSEFAKAGL